MDIQYIITNALVEYDSAKPVIKYLQKFTKYEGYKTTVDTERSTFKFIDIKTDEIVIDTEVEILAIYYDKYDVWTWSWSLTGLTNSDNYLAKEILIYALKLGSDMSYLKSILTTSRGVIKDKIQIDINLALGASIIKQPYIYPFIYTINDDKLIYYFVLLNKKDLDELSKKITKK